MRGKGILLLTEMAASDWGAGIRDFRHLGYQRRSSCWDRLWPVSPSIQLPMDWHAKNSPKILAPNLKPL